MTDVSMSTYAAIIGLMFGVVFVIGAAWRNARPTDTVGQLLQRTEAGNRPRRSDL